MKTKSKKMKTTRQTATFQATPHEVYEALMDSKKHAAFTGAKAAVSRKVGGKISAHGGYIQGKNVALVADKKIVQLWKGTESEWGDDYSTVTFALAKTAGGTKLTFTQTDVPATLHPHLVEGWKEHYWKPMKNFLD